MRNDGVTMLAISGRMWIAVMGEYKRVNATRKDNMKARCVAECCF